ncbi:unnamed protein product [Allacma fusca]|uniref:J domain-containing protein n=1 Tax=Allacma fusca TaxID=39272 RepID=A0A8J2LKH5_9HEXA|nr:unnamed protein product [Allacma fusca]
MGAGGDAEEGVELEAVREDEPMTDLDMSRACVESCVRFREGTLKSSHVFASVSCPILHKLEEALFCFTANTTEDASILSSKNATPVVLPFLVRFVDFDNKVFLEFHQIMTDRKFRTGKQLCTEGKLEEGLKLMKEAVDINPTKAEFRGHRAYWLQENGQFDEAKKEALTVLIKLNPSYLMAYQVYYNSCLLTGDVRGMQDAILRMKSCPGRVTKSRCKIEENEQILMILKEFCVRLTDLEKTKNFYEILKICKEALKIAPYSNEILVKKGIALFGLKRFAESVEAFKEIPSYSTSFRLLDIMSKAEYLSLKFPPAMEYNRQAIDLLNEAAPERKNLIKFRESMAAISEEIKEVLIAMQNKDWKSMQERAANTKNLINSGSYKNERLKLQMMNFEAGAFVQQKKLDEAFVLVNEVLSAWDTNYEALSILVDINITVGKYHDALTDLERLKGMKKGVDDQMVDRRILEAKTKQQEMKHATEPPTRFLNLYTMLKLPVGATDSEIRSQYRNLSRTYHPDKTRHLSEAEQNDANNRLLKIQTAYGILSDPGRRNNYDKGLAALESRNKTDSKNGLVIRLEENRKKYPKVFGLASSSEEGIPSGSSATPTTAPSPESTVTSKKRVQQEDGVISPDKVKRFKAN